MSDQEEADLVQADVADYLHRLLHGEDEIAVEIANRYGLTDNTPGLWFTGALTGFAMRWLADLEDVMGGCPPDPHAIVELFRASNENPPGDTFESFLTALFTAGALAEALGDATFPARIEKLGELFEAGLKAAAGEVPDEEEDEPTDPSAWSFHG